MQRETVVVVGKLWTLCTRHLATEVPGADGAEPARISMMFDAVGCVGATSAYPTVRRVDAHGQTRLVLRTRLVLSQHDARLADTGRHSAPTLTR